MNMNGNLDHSSHDEFTAYYAEKSVRPEQLRHFGSVRGAILRVLKTGNGARVRYDVLYRVDANNKGKLAKTIITSVRAVVPLRFWPMCARRARLCWESSVS